MKFTKIFLLATLLILFSCDKPIFDNPADTDNTIKAPTNLQIEQLSLTSCKLTWTDNSNGEQGFKIDRKIDDGEWQVGYKEVFQNVHTLIDTGLIRD